MKCQHCQDKSDKIVHVPPLSSKKGRVWLLLIKKNIVKNIILNNQELKN